MQSKEKHVSCPNSNDVLSWLIFTSCLSFTDLSLSLSVSLSLSLHTRPPTALDVSGRGAATGHVCFTCIVEAQEFLPLPAPAMFCQQLLLPSPPHPPIFIVMGRGSSMELSSK